MNKDRSWHKQASCNNLPDPDFWHYENTVRHTEQEEQATRSALAILVCMECPVKAQCLEQGLEDENILSGMGGCGSIWGGLLTSERAILAGYGHNHNSVWHERRHSKRVRQLLGSLVR